MCRVAVLYDDRQRGGDAFRRRAERHLKERFNGEVDRITILNMESEREDQEMMVQALLGDTQPINFAFIQPELDVARRRLKEEGVEILEPP